MESLLKLEMLMDDEAMVLSFPDDPTYAKPCESAGKKKLPEMVDDPVAKKLLAPVKPMAVVVEL